MDTMQLGGNIELNGFNELERSKLVVVKKIVGNYAKEFSDKTRFDKLSLTLALDGTEFKIAAELFGDKPVKSELKDKNLFFVIGNIMENIKKEL